MALSVVASPAYRRRRGRGGRRTVRHPATTSRTRSAATAPSTTAPSRRPSAHGIERFFRTAYTHQLAQSWFPAVDGLVERLDDGARVADVGCGHGAATLIMARTWPRSEFIGFDLDEPSVTVARSRAADDGRPGNVAFRVAEAARISVPARSTSWCSSTRCTTWATRPRRSRRAHDLLSPDGILVAVEPWSTDRLEDSIGNPIARLDYAISTSMCTPTSLAQPGGLRAGHLRWAARGCDCSTEAGFVDARLAADTGHNLVLTARAGN